MPVKLYLLEYLENVQAAIVKLVKPFSSMSWKA